MAWDTVDLGAHSVPGDRIDDQRPVVVKTDATGTTFGRYPQRVPVAMHSTTGERISSELSSPMAYSWSGGSSTLTTDPENGGQPGPVRRLAFSTGPAYSESVCNHELTGSAIRPNVREESIRTIGPVGRFDLGNYLAVSAAQSQVNFPDEDLAQLRVLLGI